MKRANITRALNTITLTRGDGGPLPARLIADMTPYMTYGHIHHLRGKEAYIDGVYTPIHVEQRRQYTLTKDGILICPAGYRDRLYTMLRDAGYEVDMWDDTPRKDMDVLSPDRARLEAIFLRKVTLRYRQAECIDAILDRISRGLGGCIRAVAGYGKSFMAVAVAAALPKARVAMIVPGVELIYKTQDECSDYLTRVGVVGDGKKDYQRVTVYSMASLHLLDERTDVVLFDECHCAAAAKTAEVFGSVVRNAVPFGLSASIGARSDGADALMEAMFGPLIFDLGWEEAVREGVVVPINVKWHRVATCSNVLDGLQGTKFMQKAIWQNEDRHKVIASVVAEEIPEDEQALIFVATIEHAVRLRLLLPDFELCYGDSADEERLDAFRRKGLIDKRFVRLDRRGRSSLRNGFKNGSIRRVIATDVWAKGMSFNALQHLVRADARQSEIMAEQIPGRTSRLNEDKVAGYVHDFDDSFHYRPERWAKVRRGHYKSRGWTQTWAGGVR